MSPAPMRLPLTFQQRWLWTLIERQADWNCMLAYAFSIKGTIDISLLRRSLNAVVRRHESLRTRVVVHEGIPRQYVDPPNELPLQVDNVCGSSPQDIEDRARQIFHSQFANRKVASTAEPLLDTRVLRLTEREHWLILAVHRIAVDCFSLDEVIREIWLLYAHLLDDRPLPFAADPPQYAAYTQWQHDTHAAWLNAHGPYWTRRLLGAKSLEFPTDPHRATRTPSDIEHTNSWLGATLSARLRDLGKNQRTLAATVMLAIFVAALWRWCRQTDFIVPFNVAGRQAEHRSVVGYFSHILYLRIQLTGRERFSDLLSLVSNEFYRALSHQDFGRLATERPELLAGTFFQWITWHEDSAAGSTVPAHSGVAGLDIQRVSVRDFGEGLTAIPPGMVDFEFSFFDTAVGINACATYRTEVFAADTIERFMRDLRLASEEFVQDPYSTLTPAIA